MNNDSQSFNFKKDNRQRGDHDEMELAPFTWKEHAFERLKALYSVGRLLTSLDDIEKAFPELLTICADTFPFLTATIIERSGHGLNVIAWNANNTDQESIDRAIANAKESFIYLTKASESEALKLRSVTVRSRLIDNISTAKKSYTRKENVCVIPLVVDRLPAFGIFQIEGSLDLTVSDLEFIGALGDLISIALDRHHKSNFERELLKREEAESLAKLSRSTTSILNLEAERDLRERFVSLLTHDLRTPLSAIKMNTYLIEKNCQNAQTVHSCAVRINDSVSRADQMISNLLDANLIRSGEKLPLTIEYFDLAILVEKTLSELSTIHNSRFVLNSTDQIQGYWDSRGIRRILENLCNNAVKYGLVNSQIRINIFEDADNVILEVCNQGDVISEQDQKFLFDQFRRGRKKIAIKGWGIGLTLVKGVAEAHGGAVKVKSDLEKGTVFTVTLPLDSRAFIIH